MENSLINDNEREKFQQWLELNLESISWEGRYLSEFNEFWDNLFLENKDASFHVSRIFWAKSKAVSGPLVTWFNWLAERFLCFVYITKDVDLKTLSGISDVGPQSLSLVLRDFFIERFPHLEEKLNQRFHVGNLVSENLYLRYSELKKEFGFAELPRGALEDDILKSLEITLYEDWKNIASLLKKTNEEKDRSSGSDIRKKAFRKQARFFRELVALFLVGGLLIFGIKAGNKYYEDYLAKKISLFEPNFFWLDKNLSFETKDPLASKEVELSYRELEDLEKLESKKVFEDNAQTQRFEVESDVALTSVDALPKDFTVADLERSEYEEIRKGGYRNSRYGRRLAYRVMMTSVQPDETKKKLLNILRYFDVKQADNVKPGTQIPGGLYFNLYVPRKELKEFLSRVSEIEESTILESKTVFGAPYGTNKVFIWIKNL